MFNFLFTIGLSAVFHKLGFRFLFRSRVFKQNNSDLLSYIFYMLSGVVVGEFLSIQLAFHYLEMTNEQLIFFATISSIILGELVYFRNWKRMDRILTNLNKDKV